MSTSENLYRYYSAQRPVDIATYPRWRKDDGNETVANIVNFDSRIPVEGESFSAWGYIEYTTPLSDQEILDYELRASSSILAARDPSEAPRSVHQNNLADCGDSISLLEQHNAEVAAYCGAFDAQCLDHALVAKIHTVRLPGTEGTTGYSLLLPDYNEGIDRFIVDHADIKEGADWFIADNGAEITCRVYNGLEETQISFHLLNDELTDRLEWDIDFGDEVDWKDLFVSDECCIPFDTASLHRAAGNYLIKNGFRFAQGVQSPRNASLADKQAELAAIANNRSNTMRENPAQER